MGEAAFVIGTVLLGIGTPMLSAADFGMGMTVAPAYLLSAFSGSIPPGTMCYICQGGLVILTCILRRRLHLPYLFTFLAAFLFGQVVNLTTLALGAIPPSGIAGRIGFFVLGELLNAVSVAFLLNSYFPPQAPELFTREVSGLIGISVYKGKYIYDLCSCALSIALSFIFFGRLRMIGAGTVVCALINGPLIGFFGKKLSEHIDFSPRFPKIAAIFDEKG